jgi:hypothetical protein
MFRHIPLLLPLLAALLVPQALAEPITLVQLRDEFAKRDAEALDIAYLDGHPVMTGEMLGQSFDAILRDCEGPQKACEAIRYVSCREMPGFSRIEALEIANAHNAGYKNATAYAEEKWFGQVVCIRLQQEFRDETKFGLRQIFEWQIELEDFLQEMDDAQTDKLAENVLDNAAE